MYHISSLSCQNRESPGVTVIHTSIDDRTKNNIIGGKKNLVDWYIGEYEVSSQTWREEKQEKIFVPERDSGSDFMSPY